MFESIDYTRKAEDLLFELGVDQLRNGTWGFTEMSTPERGYIHHSHVPVALVAYAMVNPAFAAGRFPGYTLTQLVDKMPVLDGAEYTALAKLSGAEAPAYPSTDARAEVFGSTVLEVIDDYGLEGFFMRVKPYSTHGLHYTVRPRGYDWEGDRSALPDDLKAIRKCYQDMTTLKKLMTLTILHLYKPGQDRHFLHGARNTKFHAAEAVDILRNNGSALPTWGRLISHYAGW